MPTSVFNALGSVLAQIGVPRGGEGVGGPATTSGFSGLTCYFLGFGSISGPDGSET